MRSLKPGARVAIGIFKEGYGTGKLRATVKEVHGFVVVTDEGNFHRWQVRRLRKKEKPAEERERFQFSISRHAKKLVQSAAGTAVTHIAATSNPAGLDDRVTMVELRSGEAIVSRSSLAAAWDLWVKPIDSDLDPAETSSTFRDFVKALGLGKDGA